MKSNNKFVVLYISNREISSDAYFEFIRLGLGVIKLSQYHFCEREVKEYLGLSRNRVHSIIIETTVIDSQFIRFVRSLISYDSIIKIVTRDNINKEVKLSLLKSGIDDVLLMPVDIEELALRTLNMMKRIYSSPFFDEVYTIKFGNCKLDPETRMIQVGESRSLLTDGEHQVLLHLIGNKGRYNSRQELSRALGKAHHSISSRSIDMLIGRLRKKIQDNPKMPEYIVTSRGKGYMLTEH